MLGEQAVGPGRRDPACGSARNWSGAAEDMMATRAEEIADRLLALIEARGGGWYGLERINEAAHSLQCAALAERHGAPTALIAAALLHDIGHLLDGAAEDDADRGCDDRHEEIGADYLAQWFGPEVTEPVRLHVAAKRYLCATASGYAARLSEASTRSLALQGGPLGTSEIAALERNAGLADAVRLRQWDEDAKVVGMPTPPLDHFRATLVEVLLSPRAGRA
ncbi:MAG: HD domain-containing protein [Proteobacteria bacterium]|nr:HD domain-containing protein [Pseudomonadota bacterium]